MGDNIKKVDTLEHDIDNAFGGPRYSIYFCTDGSFGKMPSDMSNRELYSKQSFIFNDRNKITEIVLAKVS